MNGDVSHRRRFFKLCAAAVAALGTAPRLGAQAGEARSYPRARLVHHDGSPLRASDLVPGESYVFHYPYVATPCFLLDLGSTPPGPIALQTAGGASYHWEGGVGPKRSIVAFSAICAHKMSHPARAVSFINYRAERTSFYGSDHQRHERDRIIYCCSEKSVYDPARGAQVIGGPAPQPLATILLEYDPRNDTLTATGTRGGEMFAKYFSTFRFRLELEHQTKDLEQPAGPQTPVYVVSEYCRTLIRC